MPFNRVRLEHAGCLSDAISWLLNDFNAKPTNAAFFRPNMEMNEAFSPLEVDIIAQNKSCDHYERNIIDVCRL